MTLTLFDGGCFSWEEWAQYLGAEIAALEKLSIAKGLTTRGEMLARKDEWDRAARATPHGKPIVLPGR
jgi:hypothetical protein